MIKKVLSITLLLMVVNGCVGTVRIAKNSNETARTNISKQSHDINQTNLKK